MRGQTQHVSEMCTLRKPKSYTQISPVCTPLLTLVLGPRDASCMLVCNNTIKSRAKDYFGMERAGVEGKWGVRKNIDEARNC